MGFGALELDDHIIHQAILARLVKFASPPWGDELRFGDIGFHQSFSNRFRIGGTGPIDGIAEDHEAHETTGGRS